MEGKSACDYSPGKVRAGAAAGKARSKMAGKIVNTGEGVHEDTMIRSLPSLHPLMAEFLKLLPATGAKLDVERATALKQGFCWILDLIYPKQ